MFDFTAEPGKKRWNRELVTDGPALVSIITAYYNGSRYFEQTFNCVVDQTFPWFEWIIVDDGSTNAEDVALLERFAAKDERIRVIHQQNGGAAKARNEGMRAARSPIVIPLDCDDLIAPTYVEVLWWALHLNPDAAWAFTDSCGFQDNEYIWDKPFSSRQMKQENILVLTAALRKQVMEEVGYYPENRGRQFFEDWALWLSLLQKGYYPVRSTEIGFWYRRTNTGKLSSDLQNREQLRYFEEMAAKVEDGIDGIAFPRQEKEIFRQPRRNPIGEKAYRSHDKKRMLLMIPWMVTGGADQFNLDLTRMLADQYDITIVTTLPSDHPLRQRFEELTPEVYCLANFMSVADYPEFISYLIETREIDVLLNSNSYHGYGMLPWLRKLYPELIILDYVHMEEWYWRAGGFARISGVLHDVLEKTCVCNERTRKVMINDFARDPGSVETVYIGVDHRRFDPDTVEPGQARRELGMGPDQPMVLFPCRLNVQKRPYLMLDIADELRKRVPGVVFVAVGDGPERAHMDELIMQRDLGGTVWLIGERKDLRPYYRDAQATLICSIKEGLALTAYESCSMGTPVVSSDVGGQGELVDDQVGALKPLLQDEGSDLTNYCYSPEEIGQYVDALEALIRDPALRERMGRNGRERILKGFSLDAMSGHMRKVIDELSEDPDRAAKRRAISEAYNAAGGLCEEYCAMVFEYDSATVQSKELWDELGLERKRLAALEVAVSTPTASTPDFASLTVDPATGAQIRLLSPAMARFVDKLTRLSMESWWGPRLKGLYRGIRRRFRK